MSLNMRIIAVLMSIGLIAGLSACTDENVKSETAAEPTGVAELYEVHHDGRINLFYDRALYQSFLEVEETPFRLTQIAAGPNGETIVYGLTKDDKKKGINTPAAQLVNGEIKPSEDFYGEMHRHGRIYVFNNLKDMETVRNFGHPNFFYTQIGSGPKGETIVYVLNKSNKKHKPVALMEKFKAMNS